MNEPTVLKVFVTAAAFAAAHPEVALSPDHGGPTRRYDASGLGVCDDMITPGRLLSIDFLTDGGGTDLAVPGIVVVTGWGEVPIYVLSGQVILSRKWRRIHAAAPTLLSEVCSAIIGGRQGS